MATELIEYNGCGKKFSERHSFIHSFTHSFVRWFVRLFACSSIHSFVYLLAHSLTFIFWIGSLVSSLAHQRRRRCRRWVSIMICGRVFVRSSNRVQVKVIHLVFMPMILIRHTKTCFDNPRSCFSFSVFFLPLYLSDLPIVSFSCARALARSHVLTLPSAIPLFKFLHS